MIKFFKLCFLVFITFFLFCNNRKIDSVFSEWMDKEIRMPSNCVWTVLCSDTVEFNITTRLKVLSYIDSIGCLRCKSQFPLWVDFIREVQSICDTATSFCFFIHPNRYFEARNVILKDSFPYPVCIDLYDSINTLNKFDADERFHCFLLDENNRVLVIGNPVQNPKIKELYLRTISEQLGVVYYPLNNSTIDKSVVNFETFSILEHKIAEFVIPNNSQMVMEIDSVYTSCECTSAVIDKQVIHPNEKALLSITYSPDGFGEFYREVYVKVKDLDKPLVYSIKGTVIQ